MKPPSQPTRRRPALALIRTVNVEYHRITDTEKEDALPSVLSGRIDF